MNISRYNITQHGGISQWDKALPLGSGGLGALLYGTDTIKLVLDRVDLWDNRIAPAAQEANFNYDHLKALVNSGSDEDWQEYLRLFNNLCRHTAYPSKITAGRLELTFDAPFTPSFSLALENGLASVSDENNVQRMTGFTDAVSQIGVFRLKGDYAMQIHIPTYISEKTTMDETVQSSICSPLAMGYPEATIAKEDGFTYTRQQTHTGFEYGIVVLEKECGEWRELYCTITTGNDGEDDLSRAKEALCKAAETGYEALFEAHNQWWQTYWSKSSIRIGDELLEKVYYRSQYLFACCSRKGFYPMPLQGVWTADDDVLPPWKGDYHHDLNTQLSYQAYLKANHLPEGEVFLDYLWDLRDAFRAYARDFFHVDGLLIPGTSTLDGKPMGGWPQYSFSPTLAIWVAQSFDEYYLYTGDEEFLRNRAYPFFSEIGEAITGLLEERNGKVYLPLSSSPEVHDNRREAYLKPNSNFDLALLRYLYETLIGYARVLNDANAVERWTNVYCKLDDIAIDDNTILLTDGEALEESHRHFGHLMCLYPLHQINFDTEEHKAIYRKTLYELERLGTGMWVGFSFAWAAQLYAMAQNGNGAWHHLYTFAHGFVEDNGFHLNGDFRHYGYSTFHYRPFTLESSFSFCDALHEMLLQDHMGYVHVFPAIPDEWKDRDISFTDLRSRGGVLVSAVRSVDGVRELRLKSEKEQLVRIRNPFSADTVCVTMGDRHTKTVPEEGMIAIKLLAGKRCTIKADS